MNDVYISSHLIPHAFCSRLTLHPPTTPTSPQTADPPPSDGLVAHGCADTTNCELIYPTNSCSGMLCCTVRRALHGSCTLLAARALAGAMATSIPSCCLSHWLELLPPFFCQKHMASMLYVLAAKHIALHVWQPAQSANEVRFPHRRLAWPQAGWHQGMDYKWSIKPPIIKHPLLHSTTAHTSQYTNYMLVDGEHDRSCTQHP